VIRDLLELFRYRDVLVNLVKREMKVRYKNSVLGFFWSLLNPLLQILVLVLVFKYFTPMAAESQNYSILLVTTILPWYFFAQVLQEGSASVAEEIALVKKAYFPRAILPIASLSAGIIHFLLSLIVLVGMFVVVRVTVRWDYVPLFVVCFLIQVCFMLGLMLLTSALSVFYNDVRYMLGSITMMWFFMSPVLYFVNQVMASHRLTPFMKQLYMLNPLAPIMVGYRSIVPNDKPPTIPTVAVPDYYVFLAISAGVAVVVLIIGGVVFGRYQWTFAEHG
jgi:lipopolysaccharide transport system permease protein